MWISGFHFASNLKCRATVRGSHSNAQFEEILWLSATMSGKRCRIPLSQDGQARLAAKDRVPASRSTGQLALAVRQQRFVQQSANFFH
jgi:hypothetical protein